MSRQRVFFVFVLSPRLFLYEFEFSVAADSYFSMSPIAGFSCLAHSYLG